MGLIASCILLIGCSTMRQPMDEAEYDASFKDPGSPAHYMSYREDNKGSHYFPVKREPTGKKLVIFDPKATAWAAYDADGNRVNTGRASGGQQFCSDVGQPCKTVSGKFRVFRKEGAECVSKKFPIGEGGAPMPYCMFFHNGYAMHGSLHVPDYNASHGCIRMLPSSAKWLSDNFVDIGTEVEVRPY